MADTGIDRPFFSHIFHWNLYTTHLAQSASYMLQRVPGACLPENFENLTLEMVHSRAYFGPKYSRFFVLGTANGGRGGGGRRRLGPTMDPLLVKLPNEIIKFFTHLKLCLATAIHNFKWVKVNHICLYLKPTTWKSWCFNTHFVPNNSYIKFKQLQNKIQVMLKHCSSKKSTPPFCFTNGFTIFKSVHNGEKPNTYQSHN